MTADPGQREVARAAGLKAATGAPLRVVGTAFLRARPLVVAPLFTLMLTTLAMAPIPRRQWVAMTCGFTVLFGFFLLEAYRGRRELLNERWLLGSLLLTLTMITGGCVLSGGLQSPLLPLLFAPSVVGFSAFGWSGRSRLVLGFFAVLSLGLGLLPAGRPFPPLPAPYRELLLVGALLTSGLLLFIGVTRLTDAFASASRALSLAGEEVVATARSRGEALAHLGARVAHEIKNPLTAVKGLLEVMIEEGPEARQARRLTVMAGEVHRIEQTLAEYLSFSRPLGTLERQTLQLGPLVAEVLAVLDARAASAGIQLSSDGPLLSVRLDPRRLKEALLNLLLNALEVTPAGGRVAVGWSAEADGALVRVEDSGPGLSPEQLARLGEAFHTTRPGGTGLGVLLAREVARLHGGRLDYESEPGRGTVARLLLPGEGAPS